MAEEKPVTKKTRREMGFTLLELIAVMGIIVALSLVVVGGYASIMRTMSEMAGVNAMRKAAMLCRQHACIDGRDTYFFITGFDTYVLCRKAGTISDRNTRSRSGIELPSYISSGQVDDAIWISDKYSDLNASSESFPEMTKAEFEEFSKGYTGTMLFDLGKDNQANEDKGETAFVKYPPWFDYLKDEWVMGLSKTNKLGEAIQGFQVDNQYGWTVYPEQKLPKGYAFIEGKDNFIEEGNFYFKADGTRGAESSLTEVSVQELGTKKVSTIKIRDDGKIESAY